eukprot:COSAG06_NODE_1909_length_8084_cov_66.552536_2_plen_128_part_00
MLCPVLCHAVLCWSGLCVFLSCEGTPGHWAEAHKIRNGGEESCGQDEGQVTGELKDQGTKKRRAFNRFQDSNEKKTAISTMTGSGQTLMENTTPTKRMDGVCVSTHAGLVYGMSFYANQGAHRQTYR